MRIVSSEELQERNEALRMINEITRRYADDVMEGIGFKPHAAPIYSTGEIAYIRNKSKNWETIIFTASPKGAWIRLQAKTGGELWLGSFVPGVPDHWLFDSVEEFEGICPKMVDTAALYCPRLFELVSKAQRRPRWDGEHEFLFDNRERLAAEFMEAYGFPEEPFFTDLKRLERMLADRTDQSYEEVREFLLQAAAYFGEAVRKRFGGEWGLQESCICFIGFGDLEAVKRNKSGDYCNVLVGIACAWSSPFKINSDLVRMFLGAGRKSGSVDERFLSAY